MSHPVLRRAGLAATAALVVAGLVAPAAQAAPAYDPAPDIIGPLSGFDALWTPTAGVPLHGTVAPAGAATVARNDELVVWVNQHATASQRFRALQDAEYDNAAGTAYDQSFTIADGLGSVLGPVYVQGRRSGALPLTSALVNSETGTAGAFVSTSGAKARFSYPRPYLPTDPASPAVASDAAGCDPSPAGSNVNASSLAALRQGRPYAAANGDLRITRVPDVVDTTHEFSPNDVPLTGAYGQVGLCTGGAFPSGHATTAYQAGFTLATLLPELAPQILARASEAAANRLVLGVHYPLDVVGGRMAGELALATRWSDPAFVRDVLRPARAELVGYLERACGEAIARCIERQRPYTDSPFGGLPIPGGSAQVVTDRASAARVFRERIPFGIAPTGSTGLAPSVPASAQALLTTAFPTLTPAQRTSVLAQTEVASGHPLDRSGTPGGSWQRLDLAAAMSARVLRRADGAVRVLGTGGRAEVVDAPPATRPRVGAVTCRAHAARPGARTRQLACRITHAGTTRVLVRVHVAGRTITRIVPTPRGSARVVVRVPRHHTATVVVSARGTTPVERRVRT